MEQQHFVQPEQNTPEGKLIDSEKLIKVVDKVAFQLNDLHGYEIEWVIQQLRSQVFPLVKLSNIPDPDHQK